MGQSEYLIIRFKDAGENHAVKICIGVIVEDMSVTRRGKHYFLVFRECEIGLPLEVLEKIVDLVNHILILEE